MPNPDNGHLYSCSIGQDAMGRLQPPPNAFIKPGEDSIKSVLVIGCGNIAERQQEAYKHWLDQGVSVSFADISRAALDRMKEAFPGVNTFLLPKDYGCIDGFVGKFGKRGRGGAFDYIFVNNVPEAHLDTVSRFSHWGKHIIVQKPQDDNFPHIVRFAENPANADILAKLLVHDHFRNKALFPLLIKELPEHIATHGRIERVMIFITEAKSVNDEKSRLASLKCGMIQDLGVHVFDNLLETLMYVDRWSIQPGANLYHRRVQGSLSLNRGVRMAENHSPLPPGRETLAVLDFEVNEIIEGPVNDKGEPQANCTTFPHKFQVLVVLGKGVHVRPGEPQDMKSISFEFQEEGSTKVYDIGNMGANARQSLPVSVNTHHGGLCRPLMLLLPDPPCHAVDGLGGIGFPQWQSIALSTEVAALSDAAQRLDFGHNLTGYNHGRSLEDLIRQLAAEEKIGAHWTKLQPFTSYLFRGSKGSPFFD